MANFTIKAFYEKDAEISAAVQESYHKYFNLKADKTLINMNPEQFTEGLDIEMMYRDMYLASEGYIWEMVQRSNINMDEMEKGFTRLINFLEKRIFKKGVNNMEIIKTENLTKYYGRSRGIVNLNLTVNQGEFFGFIEPNGAGKSTTIRTLLGLIAPTLGTATVFGKDITKEKEAVLQNIGYIPSEALFYSGMRVKDVLKLSSDLRKRDFTKEAKILCERLQLDTGRKVDELSFGNRKKVAIVCALQHKPDLLVLDEPTGGLDLLMQKEFFDILRERNNDGATVFMSGHILSEIQQNCTRAAIIRDGEIIAATTSTFFQKQIQNALPFKVLQIWKA